MRTNDRRLRLRHRVTQRDEPDLGKLIEWVLNIAEARHRAWLNGEPDPCGLPPPESTRAEQSDHLDGGAKFAPPSPSSRERIGKAISAEEDIMGTTLDTTTPEHAAEAPVNEVVSLEEETAGVDQDVHLVCRLSEE